MKQKASKFQYYKVYQLRKLIYYLNACYAILYPKAMGSGIQAIDKTNELLSLMPSIMVPWDIHITNS